MVGLRDEMLAVVDDSNQVIGQASRADVYARTLAHRIVHVFVFNAQKEVLLQLRSTHASYLPHYWTTSVGGHVKAGERESDAARRECIEELGVDIPLTEVFHCVYHDNEPKKFITVFRGIHNGPFSPRDTGVERVEFFPVPHISLMIKNGEKVHAELAFLMGNPILISAMDRS